jgi:hypothetical protein
VNVESIQDAYARYANSRGKALLIQVECELERAWLAGYGACLENMKLKKEDAAHAEKLEAEAVRL